MDLAQISQEIVYIKFHDVRIKMANYTKYSTVHNQYSPTIGLYTMAYRPL